MVRKKDLSLVAILLFVGLVVSGKEAMAQKRMADANASAPGSWRMLGHVIANLSANHDVIVARAPYENFRRIKFKVADAPIKIAALLVTYDTGAPERLVVRARIERGGESRGIDLRDAGNRNIRKIEFWYDTAGVLDGTAKVSVFGLK